MKRDVKKILVLGLFSIMLISFVASIAIAQERTITGEVDSKTGKFTGILTESPDANSIYGKVLLYIFGDTWSEVIAGIMILIIIMAAAYDILAITGIFDKSKGIIAFGIGVLSVITPLLRAINGVVFTAVAAVAGGSIGITLLLIFGIFGGLMIASAFGLSWLAKIQGARNRMKAEIGTYKMVEGVNTLGAVGNAAERVGQKS